MVTWFKICFEICSKIFKTCPRSVNNFRTEHLGGDIFWIVGPLTSLKHPSMSKQHGIHCQSGNAEELEVQATREANPTFVQ